MLSGEVSSVGCCKAKEICHHVVDSLNVLRGSKGSTLHSCNQHSCKKMMGGCEMSFVHKAACREMIIDFAAGHIYQY